MTSAINYTNEYRTMLGMINNFYDAYDVENDRENPLRLSTWPATWRVTIT